ncbi:Swt1 family HEPN domain-containing protein, partial [Spirillospora sp. NPDC046719]
MRTTGNRDLIGQGLENLLEGLRPFVDRTMTGAWGTGWVAEKERRDNERYGTDGRRGYSLNDTRFLLNVIVQEREIFKPVLPRPGLSLASRLRLVGKKYGHQYNSDAFADDETREALHAMAQLLSLVGATAATRAVADLTARVGAGASAPPPPGAGAPPPGAGAPPPGAGAP